MYSKKYDYNKNCFKWVVNDLGEYTYYLKINNDYIEVSKEVYLVCLRSYEKIKYDKKREVARSLQYFEDIDQATSFTLSTMTTDITSQIYIKDLANLTVDEIYKLPEKYKNIAIYLFIDELSERETAAKLGIPKSTVHKRKIKIKKILQEILKKGGHL